MPYFQHDNVNFHYEEVGAGDPIIALHGFSQHSDYWMKTGVAEVLAKTHRVVALDMRAHGLTTVEGKDKGYDVETMANDIGVFADHLGLDKFNLLGHSTGGMIAVRYAMKNSARLHSLLLNNCSSATNFSNLDPFQNRAAIEMMAISFETFSWPMIVTGMKLNSGPLFAGVAANEKSGELFDFALELMKAGDRKQIARFVRKFYDDPDPRIEALKKITCPTLIISAELDRIFRGPSEIMALHIPNAKHIIGQGMGHMTALEAPDWLSQQMHMFLDKITIWILGYLIEDALNKNW